MGGTVTPWMIHAAATILTVLAFSDTVSSEEDPPHFLEWTVIGDSWASGVAYNRSNVYGPIDLEFCYRTKESWGAQMYEDKSRTLTGGQWMHFAACGGTLMDDLKRQMAEKAHCSSVVWGMFGGNNAFFGAIARACIYQPYSLSSWGPAWDQDPDGKGLRKQNLKNADHYIKDPTRMRIDLESALDDILTVAQDGQHRTSHFNLYVSGYVRFFDETTHACNSWTFAHDRVSSGRPKLVNGLRKEINDMVQHFNDIQPDVINSYEIPAPKLAEHRVRNAQPDGLFEGHRFCEENRTFEGQFYHSDLWLWNLQYNDEQKGEQAGVVMQDANGVTYMGAPEGVDVTQGFVTVLGSDNNTNITIQPGDEAQTQQYGLAGRLGPSTPRGPAEEDSSPPSPTQSPPTPVTSLPSPPPPPLPPSPPPPLPQKQCYGLGQNKYITRDGAKYIIENHFCLEAAQLGPIERKYNEGTPEETVIRLQGPAYFRSSTNECILYLRMTIIDTCDGDNPQNPMNYKGGGKETIGDVVYELQPLSTRQPADLSKQGGCSSTYKALFNEYWVWGVGWDNSDHGLALVNQLDGCALLPDTWHFDYGLGSDGREWTAKFRTGVFQRKCVGHAGISAGGPPDFHCGGTG